jgi:general secretion pathway protein D
MKKLISTCIALGLVLVSFQAPAEKVTLNFSDADLVAVINSVSQITGKNFIIDPRVKGKINVVSSKPLNEEEVYNVFLSIRERNQDYSRRHRQAKRGAFYFGEQ